VVDLAAVSLVAVVSPAAGEVQDLDNKKHQTLNNKTKTNSLSKMNDA
jgi:hypothetical protein